MKSTTAGRRRRIVALVAMGLVGGISAFGGTAHARGGSRLRHPSTPPRFWPQLTRRFRGLLGPERCGGGGGEAIERSEVAAAEVLRRAGFADGYRGLTFQ